MKNTLAALLGITVFALTGCAGSNDAPIGAPPTTQTSELERPTFEGPFAAELQAAWDESGSDFVQSVVHDGVVSDQEWAELGSRMTQCLAEYGIKFEGFDGNGRYNGSGSTLSSEDLNEALSGCEASTGESWLTGIRISMATNPQNEPPEKAMTDCLKRNGAVGQDYTEKQFLDDNADLSFPFMGTAKEKAFWSCNDNPSYVAK